MAAQPWTIQDMYTAAGKSLQKKDIKNKVKVQQAGGGVIGKKTALAPKEKVNGSQPTTAIPVKRTF